MVKKIDKKIVKSEVVETAVVEQAGGSLSGSATPQGAAAGPQICAQCHNSALINMDGCLTCLHCCDSRCG